MSYPHQPDPNTGYPPAPYGGERYSLSDQAGGYGGGGAPSSSLGHLGYNDPYSVPQPGRYNPSTMSLGGELEKDAGYDDMGDEAKSLIGSHVGGDTETIISESSAGGRMGRALTRQRTNAAWARRQQAGLARAKTQKITLKEGNLVVPYAVPAPVANANSGIPGIGQDETTHMRYTAATCDPDDFTPENGFKLRQVQYGRQTDLLIAITIYNENKILLTRTLHGVMLNIRDMVKDKTSEFRRQYTQGGLEAGGVGSSWQKIVVSLIFDGVDPADKVSLDVLATIGLYADAVMKKEVDGKPTIAHIFEYTTRMSVDPANGTPQIYYPQSGDLDSKTSLVPVQLICVLKQKNAKKINSHRWLFNALGRQLKPDICVLLDAGTKPGTKSIYYLWEAFYHNKNLGGACGEIHAMLGKGGRKLLNPLVAAQNFEYKMSNVLDKPTESVFGYVSVLPGAFSAYRYQALQGRPLEQYFHGDLTLADRLGKASIREMGIFTKNMFLAEDRILCFELVAKKGDRWVLGYVKPSKAETDVPEQAAELIGQRRRWLNGSFAAGVYSLYNFRRFYQSNHGIIRMFFFHVQALYNTVTLFMSWFALGNYWLTFSIIIEIVAENLHSPDTIAGDDVTRQCWSGTVFASTKFDILGELAWGLEVIYLAFVALQIILALGNRPKGERLAYTVSFCVFAFCALYLIANTVFLTIKAFCPVGQLLQTQSAIQVFLGSTYGPIFAGLLGTFGIYIISSFLYLDPWHIFHSMPQYLLIAPSFTNILNVYAFCNLHDVSWGTKGSDKADSLPSVSSKKEEGKEAVVEVAVPTQKDVDFAFQEIVDRTKQPFIEEDEIEKPSPDDQNKTFRTRLVSVWLFMNTMLGIVVGRLSSVPRAYYFQAILWITFGLSFIRFAMFFWYLLGESIFRLARLCSRGRGPSRKR